MSKNHSSADALRNFFEKLAHQKSANVAKVISDSHGVRESSQEFYLLLHLQSDNFGRLLRQLEFSDVTANPKRTATQQLTALSNFLRHQTLAQQFDHAKTHIIDPNISALNYIEGLLPLASPLSDDLLRELKELKEALEEIKSSLTASKLSLRVRTLIALRIDDVLFLLNNIDVVSLDQIWDASSAAATTIQRELPTVESHDDVGLIAKAGGVIMRVLVCIYVGLSAADHGLEKLDSALGHADSSLKKIESIYERLGKGYEVLKRLNKPQVPLLEDRSTEPKPSRPKSSETIST